LLNLKIWADGTILYKSGFWRNFAMTSQETLYMKIVVNELSFLLVTHVTCFDIRFGRYGFLKSGFCAGLILDRLSIQVLGQVLGHKMGEICCGQNTKSGGTKLSFPTPTQTHIFSNRINGYGCLSTAYVWSLVGR
jgi:hypothetical protein